MSSLLAAIRLLLIINGCGWAEKYRGQHSAVSGSILAMEIMVIKLKLIANGNMLQALRLGSCNFCPDVGCTRIFKSWLRHRLLHIHWGYFRIEWMKNGVNSMTCCNSCVLPSFQTHSLTDEGSMNCTVLMLTEGLEGCWPGAVCWRWGDRNKSSETLWPHFAASEKYGRWCWWTQWQWEIQKRVSKLIKRSRPTSHWVMSGLLSPPCFVYTV